ncbi:elicitor-responsive protein 1 [Carica papaya]|uniref:elicitor-responsive protein 1 n=1 Tax=Carica papaya TaxID=3649 RepID=UPI000B8CF76C|nr:elicitor-responsive protein 1 [Carica papaya]
MAIGIMEVFLIKAKGLKDADFFGRMDPYVVIQYKGQVRKSSVARSEGKNPVWNEKFKLRAEYPGSGDDYNLILKIFDRDLLKADDYIGTATIYVRDLLALGVESGTAEMQTNIHRVVLQDRSYRGEIHVDVTFTTWEEDKINEEVLGGWKSSHF